MRALLKVWLITAFGLASLLPASGATVIFYSQADNAYGWCAGYSYSRGESCARQECLKYGSGCTVAIECDGGWSAAAFAYDPYAGFGASCQFNSAATARSIALVSCIYATHALCFTSETFNGSGSTTSTKSNESYDIAWYTQDLLLRLGYDIGEVDGAIGAKTRAAIREVERSVGLEPTGEANWDLINILLYIYGGSEQLARAMVAETDSVDQEAVRTYSFRYAAEPAALTLGAEIAALGEPLRLKTLAAMLNHNNHTCSVPARSALQDPTNANAWAISCAEGDFVMLATGDETIITAGDDTTVIPKPETDCPTDESDDIVDADTDTLHPGSGRAERQVATADTSSQEERDYKPSPVTVGGMNPALEAQADSDMETLKPCPSGRTANDETERDYKPAQNTVGAPPPNLGDNYINDAE